MFLGFLSVPLKAVDPLGKIRDQEITQSLQLKVGQSKVLRLPFTITRISVANPEVADLAPWVIALVAAGGLAAALSTAAGLLLAIASCGDSDNGPPPGADGGKQDLPPPVGDGGTQPAMADDVHTLGDLALAHQDLTGREPQPVEGGSACTWAAPGICTWSPSVESA